MKKISKYIILLILVVAFLLLYIEYDQYSSLLPFEEKHIMDYTFKEPTKFPFDVNESSSYIEGNYYLHEFVFSYGNTDSKQKLRFIISKVLSNEQDIITGGKTVKINDDLNGIYLEKADSQSIWWKKDSFLFRFVYSINDYREEISENKLKVDDFIDFARQVQ